MKNLPRILALIAFIVAMDVSAHGEHSHDPNKPDSLVTQDNGKAFAVRSIHKMTIRDFGFGAGKLDKSWLSIGAKDLVFNNKEKESFVYSVDNITSGETLFIKIDSIGKTQSAKLKRK